MVQGGGLERTVPLLVSGKVCVNTGDGRKFCKARPSADYVSKFVYLIRRKPLSHFVEGLNHQDRQKDHQALHSLTASSAKTSARLAQAEVRDQRAEIAEAILSTFRDVPQHPGAEPVRAAGSSLAALLARVRQVTSPAPSQLPSLEASATPVFFSRLAAAGYFRLHSQLQMAPSWLLAAR